MINSPIYLGTAKAAILSYHEMVPMIEGRP
jgi:hypothetical protein